MRRESIYNSVRSVKIRLISRTARTDVNNRPGSPKDERHEISNLPRAMIFPGACVTGNGGTTFGERM